MPIAVTCPFCRARVKVPDNLINRKVKCLKCDQPFTATDSGSANQFDAETQPRPKKRAKKKNRGFSLSGFGAGAGFRVKLVLLAGGVVLAIFGGQEWILRSAATEQPQAIALRELIAQGTSGNPHVQLTGFQLCKNFIYSFQAHGSEPDPSNGPWTEGWIPAVPAEERAARPAAIPRIDIDRLVAMPAMPNPPGMPGPMPGMPGQAPGIPGNAPPLPGQMPGRITEPPLRPELPMPVQPPARIVAGPVAPGNIQAIVKSSHISNPTELHAFYGRPTLQGMVINRIHSLGFKEREKLNESYPGTDWEKCLIIEEGRQPKSRALIAGLLGGGLILALTGLVSLLRRSAA